MPLVPEASEHFRIEIAGTGTAFDCGPEDTILSGGLRSRIGLPHECMSGGCGRCYFDLVDGEVEVLWEDAPGLSPRARSRGRMLACQTRPKSDCTLKMRPAESFVLPLHPRRRSAVLRGRRMLAPGMAEFRFATGDRADFRPGQFCLLRIPGVTGTRAYSMSNLPNAEGEWDFIIRQVPGGAATTRLFAELETGAEIGLDGPYGQAYLRPEIARDIVCIAGGSGLSPVLSIARAAARAPALADRKIAVFYGGRGPKDICVTGYWEDDAFLQARVECHTAISDPDAEGFADWLGHRGYIHEVVDTLLGSAIRDFEFYLCGPAPMIDALQDLLVAKRQVPPERLHFDRFY